jgi:hypothetical protein
VLFRAVELPFEVRELLAELVWQPVAEAREVPVDGGQLLRPFVGIDAEQRGHVLGWDGQSFGVGSRRVLGRARSAPTASVRRWSGAEHHVLETLGLTDLSRARERVP